MNDANTLIVVVEDEFFIRQDAIDILQEAGFSVLEAENADDALKLLEQHPVAVLLTDIMMPGSMDGLDLARLAKRRWSLPVVVASAIASVTADALPDGAVFVRKPFNEKMLLDAIAEATVAMN